MWKMWKQNVKNHEEKKPKFVQEPFVNISRDSACSKNISLESDLSAFEEAFNVKFVWDISWLSITNWLHFQTIFGTDWLSQWNYNVTELNSNISNFFAIRSYELRFGQFVWLCLKRSNPRTFWSNSNPW